MSNVSKDSRSAGPDERSARLPLDLLTRDELREFLDQVEADLEAAGLPEAAQRLRHMRDTAYTTGTEWWAELGLAGRDIRARSRLARDLDARVARLHGPLFSERVALRQIWEVAFYASAVLGGIAALLGVRALAGEDAAFKAALPIGALVVVVAVIGYAVRQMSRCPGCGLRSQAPGVAWCPFCGMQRSTGAPGPRRRPEPGMSASGLTMCPSCQHPPGGRSRYGRPLPSEGWFCGNCGHALPEGDPG